METLSLTISTDDLDKINDGKKNVIYLNYNDYYLSRLCERNLAGLPLEFKAYDQVHLRGGVGADVPEATYEIKGFEIVEWTDSKNKAIGEKDFVVYLGQRAD